MILDTFDFKFYAQTVIVAILLTGHPLYRIVPALFLILTHVMLSCGEVNPLHVTGPYVVIAATSENDIVELPGAVAAIAIA